MSDRFRKQAFAARCQKRNYRTSGTWMARWVARPAALHVTRLIAPTGISANTATLIAWSFGVAAAAVFAWGTPAACLIAAVLFQAWYLWDHVDGQLARLRGTVRLEGAQLDFLMHHTVNLLIPLGVGYGCFAASGQTLWLGAGTVWALAMLLIPLRHDTAYRAMIWRLQHLDGTLTVRGLADGEVVSKTGPSNGLIRRLTQIPRKACEIHVVMNVLSLLAIISFIAGDRTLIVGRIHLALAAATGAAVAAWSIAKGQVRGETEEEFSRYFHLPQGHTLQFREGLWRVEPVTWKEERAA